MPQTGLQTRQTGRIRRGCGQHPICWATWAGPVCRFRRVWPPCSTGWPSARPESCWGWMQRNPGSSGRRLCQRRQIRQLTKLSSHLLRITATLTNYNLIRIHLPLNIATRGMLDVGREAGFQMLDLWMRASGQRSGRQIKSVLPLARPGRGAQIPRRRRQDHPGRWPETRPSRASSLGYVAIPACYRAWAADAWHA